ncbi:MAG TPA: hypothetical protein VGQ36_21780 [Thermoanaerobaculia bacterium]|jgi:hypothetical protein|nr:hypothetical protein [Thermoanaerobaculia bacterium]
MNKSRMARLVVSALLLIVGPVVFGQGLFDREVVAGDTYQEDFQVLCFVGGGPTSRTNASASANASIGEVRIRVQVRPAFFDVIPEPGRISVGSLFRLTADVPVNTPPGPYEITILGIGASAAACPSTSETFTLFVRRPVQLSVIGSTQFVFPGSTNMIRLQIDRLRKRDGTRFAGPVKLETVGLPDVFGMSFVPQNATGSFSNFIVQVPKTTFECLPPQGCRIEINGMAEVPVEPTNVQLVVLGGVSLIPDRTSATVDPGREAVFRLQVDRLNYFGPVNLAVTATEKPPGGKFTTRIEPATLTSEAAFTLGITIDPSTPGQYAFQVKPANTGQTEFPVTLMVQTTAMPTITLTPTSRTITIPNEAAYDIDVTGPIKLTGAEVDKPGVMATVDAEARKLNAVTNASTPPGTYLLSALGTVSGENNNGQMIKSKAVNLIVERPLNGSIAITVKDEIVKLNPGLRTFVPINVLPKNGYAGSVELLVPENLTKEITTSFQDDDDTAILNGTETVPVTKLLIFETPFDAKPTGEMTVKVDSAPVPLAVRDIPVIRYMVTQPQLQFGVWQPDVNFPVDVRGPFFLRASVARNGCQSQLRYSYESVPANLFTIDLGTFQEIGTNVFPSPVMGETPYTLTVRVMADNCLGASFRIFGTVFPAIMIPPLVTATLAPAGQTIQRGQSAAYTLTLNRGNTQGPIAVNVTGLPAGVTASVVPNPIPGSMAQVTLNTSSSTPTGTFTFTVNATASGAPFATATAGLTVVASGSASPPTISFFTPTNGTAGTPVQITGTNFVGVQNVLFNGTGTPFATITPTQINTTVPGFATTGPITVITAGGMATSSTPFIVGTSSQAPQITGFSPTGGVAGTNVRIMGVNLGGVIAVSMGTPAFGFNPIPFTPFDATRVDVLIPPGAVSGFFRVMTLSGMATSAEAFNVTTPNLPEIGGFSPISGAAGTRVQIIGSNLAGATQVTFAGVNASFEPPQQNSIFATVPPGAMTGQIRVTTPGGTATSFSSFAVTTGGPVITDFQPQSGKVGFSVTIAGANLSGTSQVTFNGTPAPIGIVTPNFVQVFVPTGATTGPIRLVTPTGETTSSTPFTVTP